MASALPESILSASEAAMQQLLPVKSHARYIEAYNRFIDWRKEQKTESFAEEVFLAYFEQASSRYKPTTLWSIYSMLKTTIISNHNIDISKYPRLKSFLKSKMHGFESKKAEVFSPEEIRTFLLNAPDSVYLSIKAVTVFGVSGGCRGIEITNVMFDHVTDAGNEIVVRIPESKTHVSKVFPITSQTSIDIIRRYIAMRPAQSPTPRFFILQRGDKCFGQPIGKNTIAQMPQKIARYLNLENPERYTGHSFRRTSTTMVADAGASIDSLKRFYYWKSNTVAERYIQDSLGHKRTLAATITKALNLERGVVGTENVSDNADEPNPKIVKTSDDSIVNVAAVNNSTDENMPTIGTASNIEAEDNGDVVANVSVHSIASDEKENMYGTCDDGSTRENMESTTIALSQCVSNNKKNIERHTIKEANVPGPFDIIDSNSSELCD